MRTDDCPCNESAGTLGGAAARAPTTVSLVLGSGGARGLAHIGVIQWLVDNGFAIRSIAGSSIGAVIGGIYAAGKLEVYAEWVMALERVRVFRLLDPTIGRPGIFKGERIISVLRELIGERDIETLPIAYTAVATDLDTGQEVWLRRGKLFDAIRASIATPLLFTPVEHEGRSLIDGAVVNPVPVSPTRGDATDLTIAVDLGGPPLPRPTPAPLALGDPADPRSRLAKFFAAVRPAGAAKPASRGIFDVAFTAMQTMQETIAELRLAVDAPDLVVKLPRDACGYFEFWRAAEMIALGRACAARALAQAVAGRARAD